MLSSTGKKAVYLIYFEQRSPLGS